MNSFRTSDDTLKALAAHPGLATDGLPLEFLQNREPKLRSDDLTPVSWPADPTLEWCPPGHGDIYTALDASGLLRTLLDQGYRYLFVSNADNLGARPGSAAGRLVRRVRQPVRGRVLPPHRRRPQGRSPGPAAPATASWCCGNPRRPGRRTRTPSATSTGTSSSTPTTSGSTWSRWMRCCRPTTACSGCRSSATSRPSTRPIRHQPEVIQIETAMGAAIGVFEGAGAIEVDRSRFLPVKATSDLLVLRSDAYELADGAQVRLVAVAHRAPLVDLDKPYKLVNDFDARFPHGAPSLVDCEQLTVQGRLDVRPGCAGGRRRHGLRGRVAGHHPGRAADGGLSGAPTESATRLGSGCPECQPAPMTLPSVHGLARTRAPTASAEERSA